MYKESWDLAPSWPDPQCVSITLHRAPERSAGGDKHVPRGPIWTPEHCSNSWGDRDRAGQGQCWPAWSM